MLIEWKRGRNFVKASPHLCVNDLKKVPVLAARLK